jgi:peptidoglycan/LPS O-acetylase OafA/YrhL
MNPSKIRLPAGDSKDSRDFEKLVVWVSTFSIAVMAGFLASLKQVNPAIQIRFDAVSVAAFILGGVSTAVFLRIVLKANKRRRALLVVGAAIVCVLGYFLLGIKDTSRENRSDVTVGTAIAVAVLSCVAVVIWRLTRFLEADEPKNRDDDVP